MGVWGERAEGIMSSWNHGLTELGWKGPQRPSSNSLPWAGCHPSGWAAQDPIQPGLLMGLRQPRGTSHNQGCVPRNLSSWFSLFLWERGHFQSCASASAPTPNPCEFFSLKPISLSHWAQKCCMLCCAVLFTPTDIHFLTNFLLICILTIFRVTSEFGLNWRIICWSSSKMLYWADLCQKVCALGIWSLCCCFSVTMEGGAPKAGSAARVLTSPALHLHLLQMAVTSVCSSVLI